MSSSNKSSSGSGNSRSSGDFPINIIAKDVGIDQSITKLTRFADVIKNLDTQIKTSLTSMNSFSTVFTNFGRNFSTLNQGFNQGTTGANQFNQAIQNNVNTIRNGQTTLTAYMNTQKQVAPAMNQTAQAANTVSTNTQRLNQTMQQNSTITKQVTTQQQNYNRNLQQTSQSTQSAISSQNMLNQSQQKTMMTVRDLNSAIGQYNMQNSRTVTSTKDVSDAADASTTSFNNVGESIGGVISKGTGLFLSFKMMEMSYQEAMGMNEMLQASEEKLARAKETTIQMMEKHGEDSKEHQRALKQEEDITRGLAYTTRNANMAMGDFSFFTVMVASNIIGSLVPALSKWSETKGKLTKAAEFLRGSMDKLRYVTIAGTAATTANTVAEGANTAATNAGALAKARASASAVVLAARHKLGAAAALIHAAATGTLAGVTNTASVAMGNLRLAIMRNMSVLGPIGIAITAVGLAIGAVATDFMGVRTALEDFGQELGEAVPLLSPFLHGIQGIGGALGLTGDTAEETNEHFRQMTIGFENMGVLWNNTVAEMQQSNNQMVKSLGDTAAVLTVDFAEAADKFNGQLKASQDTWNQFVDALGRGDYKTATDLLISSFEAIPGIIQTSLETLVGIVHNAFTGLKNTVGPAIMGIGNELGTRLYNGIVAGISGILEWVQNSIITPIQNFFNGISTGLRNIADLIITALGLNRLPTVAMNLADAVGKGIMKIVDFVSDIAAAVWDKLQLAGLTDKALTLAKDIWNAITGFFDSAAATSQSNLGSGNTASLSDEEMKGIEQALAEKDKRVQELLDKGGHGGQLKQEPYKVPFVDSSNTPTPTPTPTTGTEKFGPPKPQETQIGLTRGIHTGPVPKVKGAADLSTTSKPATGSAVSTGGFTRDVPQFQKQDLPDQTSLERQTAHAAEAQVSAFDKAKASLQAYADAATLTAKKADDELATAMAAATQMAVTNVSANEELAIAYAGNQKAIDAYAEQLYNQGVVEDEVRGKNKELQDSLVGYSLALQDTLFQEELVKQGRLEQEKVLQDMEISILKTEGSLKKYAQQVEEGTILDAAFTQGKQEQTKVLLDAQVEIANTNGRLAKHIEQLQAGESQAVAFTQGQQSVLENFIKMIDETANLEGQFSALQVALGSTGAAQIQYNNGLARGKVATAQHIIEMDNLRGVYIGTREVLRNHFDALSHNTQGVMMSNEALDNWIQVAKGVPDAVNSMIDSFKEFANSAVNEVAQALQDAEGDIDDAFDKIEERLGDNLTGEEKLIIEVQAETQNAVDSVKNSFSLAFKWVMNQEILLSSPQIDLDDLTTGIAERMDETLEKVQDSIDNSGGFIKTAWQNIFLEMESMSDPENILNKDKWIEGANTIASNLHTIGQGADEALGFMQSLGLTTAQAVPILESAGFSSEELAKATATAGENADTANGKFQGFFATVQQAGTIESVFQTIFETNFPIHVQNGLDTASTKFSEFSISIAPAFGTVDSLAQTIFEQNIPAHALTMAAKVTEHFNRMQGNADGVLNIMETQASESYKIQGDHSFQVATLTTTNYNTARDNASGVLSQMEQAAETSFQAQGDAAEAVADGVDRHFGKAADDGINLIEALERAVVSSAGTMADALGDVADAVSDIGTSAETAKGQVDSLKSSIDNLEDKTVTITYRIRTVGSAPSGAGQFGLNAEVNKPSLFLAGEGWGKERVKIQPGTMGFVEDFSLEMKRHFDSTPSGVTQQQKQQQQQRQSSNVYAPGYQGPTNQNNNPDIAGGNTGMMISNNASLVQMNNSNGKRMIVDGKTGTIIMLNESSSSGSSGGSGNSNTNTNTGTGNSYTDERGNNYNYDNDSNSQNNVYAPGYGNNNVNPPSSTPTNGSPSSTTNTGSGINQSQSVNQSGSGQNYYYQSQTNNGVTRVNTNMNMGQSASASSSVPIPPGMINQSSSSGGNSPVSGSYSNDYRSRLLSRGDPFGFQTRIVHETPVEINIDLEGVRIARKILKILTEEMGFGSGYYG